MKIKERIKSVKWLKNAAQFILMPKGQARPRMIIKLFIHPFIIKKGKDASIRRNSRMDIFPMHTFILGDHSTIEDFSTVNNALGEVKIGHNTRIGLSNVIIGPVTVGSDVRLAQNIVVSALNHNYENPKTPICNQGVNYREITIRDGSWIGANVVITSGVNVGKNSVVAAGSVVTRDVPDYSVVAGNPARIIKQYDFETKSWAKTAAGYAKININRIA